MLNKLTNNKQGEKMNTQLCLIAIDGDMSKYGMGNTTSVISFNSSYKKEVKKYLKNASNLRSEIKSNGYIKNFNELFDAVGESFQQLKELGIFEHKYEFRTTWKLSELDKSKLQTFGKYNIEKRA